MITRGQLIMEQQTILILSIALNVEMVMADYAFV